MTYLQQLRGLGVPVLLVDGGDAFFRTITRQAPPKEEQRSDLSNASVIVNAFNLMGYHAFGIGPQDLQYGVARLQELSREARFPFLCANLVDKETKEPFFKPYEIITIGGVRFGVFAIIHDKLNPTLQKRVIPGGMILSPIDTAKQVVKELRPQCDVIVALSQLYDKTNKDLLAEVSEIDVLIDPMTRFGSKSIWIEEDGYYQLINDTPRMRIDGQGARVGVLDMTVSPEKKGLASHAAYNIPLEPHIMPHPAMALLIKKVRLGRSFSFPDKFDPEKKFPTDSILGHETCGACHAEQYEFWKSTTHAANFHTLETAGAQLRTDCIGCHSLGYGIAYVDPAQAVAFKEVQCENCHGINPRHADSPGESHFDLVGERTCWGCHNPEYTQKEFDYEAALPRASCPKMK